jgi:hypothetical protein
MKHLKNCPAVRDAVKRQLSIVILNEVKNLVSDFE